jgi:polyhydroxyalkanoate synthesis regulator protein
MADESLTTEIIERKGVVDWSQLQVDSLNVIHLATKIDSASYMALRGIIMREEMKAGRLMTAEQMSEKITGYYDKLIDVLIALFVIFSIASYFVINNRFKKKYEEDNIVLPNLRPVILCC